MSRTVGNSLMLATLAVLLAGCGATQSVTDSTASATRSIFYKQVKTLHLDFRARSAINTDARDMNAMSVPTLVRVYQLSESKALERASYDSLLGSDEQVLGGELLDTRALVIKPGEGAQLSVPLDKDARFVSVVALFRDPDTQMNTWRLILTRDDLDPERARIIELGDNRLTLRVLSRE
ncbi:MULTISPECIES: type VI secretion system lipoprotein TssJ [unclassified Pseudomonas]|uniref:type VI secretion system lipoprotein TssJ n=1 Tax=unclassified Pseudomonas TaxID=196821 RepID=UPI000C87EAA3|nr:MULTISPECIES: type VI secretion system lipoprotein TssJ [unclassified Pseudomonas]PMZ85761.1 type VI secretion system lipoprotein TssJ [Pseudomonas sp. FW215-T2]PNA08381.1 type VI secretion system lipoprotein TssJ [Pseudomonas sp. FW215-R3]PNB34621.1 type VI secretion system lipoprotein TssJ [Pseudomonas sp. FW305-131]